VIGENNVYYFKEILKLATPQIGLRVLNIAVVFIGMLLIAHLGKTELAAGVLVTAFSTTIMVIAMSPMLAIGVIISRYRGEKKSLEIGLSLRQAWLASVLIGVTASLVMWYLPVLLYHLHEPPELIPLVSAYFHGLAWATIPILMMTSCHQLYFVTRHSGIVFIWYALILLLTTLLGWPLIYGYAGLPRYGMAGWSYSISIVNWIMLAVVFIDVSYRAEFKPFQLYNWKKSIDWSQLKLFLRLGWPITMQFSAELFAFAVLNIMVGWIGTTALSIQQIVLQCSTMVLMIPMGTGQACSILIAQAVGSGEKHIIRNICYIGVAFVLLCTSAIALIYLIAPISIIALYIAKPIQIANKNMVKLAELMLGILAFSQIVDAIRNVVIGSLRGLHDTWKPMWINVVLLWGVAIPCAYVLGFTLKQGVIGLNVGFLITFALGAGLMLWRFNLKTKEYALEEFNDKAQTINSTGVING